MLPEGKLKKWKKLIDFMKSTTLDIVKQFSIYNFNHKNLELSFLLFSKLFLYFVITGATNKVYIYVCYVYDSFNIIQTTTIEKV